jgi:hypothetical protein
MTLCNYRGGIIQARSLLSIAQMLVQSRRSRIDQGLCGVHIGSRPLLGRVFIQGFYWPKAASDAADLVQKCGNCQRCVRDQKQPSSLTQLIQPTWPLQRWGLDLLGPLPPAQGNLKYVVVAVEYFSKWIEAKSLATITLGIVQKILLEKYCLPLWCAEGYHG